MGAGWVWYLIRFLYVILLCFLADKLSVFRWIPNYIHHGCMIFQKKIKICNDYFEPKNGPIDLKSGHKVYLGAFYWCEQFWENSQKNGRFLAQKQLFSPFFYNPNLLVPHSLPRPSHGRTSPRCAHGAVAAANVGPGGHLGASRPMLRSISSREKF